MKVKLLVLIILVISLAYYQEHSRTLELQSELNSLRLQFEQSKQVLPSLESRRAPKSVAAAPTSESNPIPQFPALTTEKQERKSPVETLREVHRFRAEFQTHRKLEELEQVVTLSEAERSRLSQALTDFFSDTSQETPTSDEDNASKLRDLLVGELGQERADLFMNVQKDREQKSENERIELASTMFAKHLSLSPDQQSQVTEILRGVDQKLGNPNRMLMQKLQELHTQDQEIGQSPEDAMKQYAEVARTIRDQRRSAVNEQLKSVLTPDQFNSLLSEQANSQEGLWGLRGY